MFRLLEHYFGRGVSANTQAIKSIAAGRVNSMDQGKKAPSNGAVSRSHGRRAAADPIAYGLQKLFEPILNEPVPDEFFAILDRVDTERERRSQPGGPVGPAGSTGL